MIATFPGGDRLLVGKDISDLDSFADQIKTAVISSVALIFAVAGVASILVTRRTVGRIESINATSRAIMRSGLDQRIPLRGTHDEWDRVAENLNLMLDRIETLMAEVKQVSDNVAHDLRTPLTRMRGRLEKAYHGQRGAEDDQALIGDTIADLDAVLRIFASLTRIAHIETQARKGAFRSVNLVDIANEVVELYDAAAEQDGTSLTVTGDPEVLVTGDRDLIFDAIANLVDNAIKHGRPGGHVVVANETIDGRPVVSIADDGPGIPAGQYQHVFKRFYQLDTAATRRETVSGSAWSPPSQGFMARGSKCSITRRVSGSHSGFRRRLPASPAPASKLQRNVHCGLAQLIGERLVFDRSGQHHGPHAKRGERKRALPARLRGRRHAMLEGFDHHPDRGFLRRSDRWVASRQVIGQAEQRTAGLEVAKVP